MSKFRITKGINSALNCSGNKLVDIDFLGIGGAFDIDEGMSSALLTTRSKKLFLIDCGYTSYSKIKNKDIIGNIDKVFITHCHEDHFSGISSLIFERFYIHKIQTHIECTPEVAARVRNYLDICGHPNNQYTISTEQYLYIEEDAISITKIDTTGHHWSVDNFPNSGLLFHFKTGENLDDYVVLIYSGDINKPITNLMPPDDYAFLYDNPENIFIFHDMTSLSYEQNPHTNFELLIPIRKKFKNLFTYHHNENHVSIINQKNPEMALTSLIIQGNSFVIEEVKGI